MKFFWALGISFITLSGALAYSAELSYSTGPEPAWVAPLPNNPDSKKEAASTGQICHVVDQQVNVRSGESYRRTIREIANESGLQGGSEISIEYDPEYQHLVIHRVNLERDGKVIRSLDPAKIKIIQQEKELDRYLYNGTLSAVVFLEDVRVGDRIELAYTLRGMHPILGGRYAGSFWVDWSVPVRYERIRILWPSERRLFHRGFGFKSQPAETPIGPDREYVWNFTGLPAVLNEDEVPSWIDVYRWIQFSEFPDWSSVAAWALPLYPRAELSPALLAKIEEWKGRSTNPEDRLLAALQFLQNEVRYLGFESGLGSHLPNKPAEVFARRFGDCKDKSYLLATALREMGIDAEPALVNTYARATIGHWLPSPFAFNHVVTRVRLDGKFLFVDPTRTYQSGRIADHFFPNYGRCLPVNKDVDSLAAIPPPSETASLLEIHETFRVGKDHGATELVVESTARGLEAERMRSYLKSHSPEEVVKSYLNFYAVDYPDIVSLGAVEVRDHSESNVVRTVESYRIKNLWTTAKDEVRTASFYPRNLKSSLSDPNTKLRTHPLSLSYPYHLKIRTEVCLPEEWDLKNENGVSANKYEKMNWRRHYSNQVFLMDYDYRTSADLVPASAMASFLKSRDEMRGFLGYDLTWGKGGRGTALAGYSWSIGLIVLLTTALLIGGSLILYRRRTPALESVEPKPIGGWLIFVGAGFFLSVPAIVFQLLYGLPNYERETWASFTTPGGSSYHWLWEPVLLGELVLNLSLLAMNVFLAVLFFQKRGDFPRFFTILVSISLVGLGLDHLSFYAIPSLKGSEGQSENLKFLIASVLRASIWIPYLLFSKRVKETFVR